MKVFLANAEKLYFIFQCFFQLLRRFKLRKLILDAFENNDDAVINAIASECCTEKNRDWLELGSDILNSGLDGEMRKKVSRPFLVR